MHTVQSHKNVKICETYYNNFLFNITVIVQVYCYPFIKNNKNNIKWKYFKIYIL